MAIIDPGLIREVTVEEEWATRERVCLDSVPAKACCYAVVRGNRCLYVGRAVNLKRRLALHQIRQGRINGINGAFNSECAIYAVSASIGYLSHLEKLLIAYLRPEINYGSPLRRNHAR